MPIITRISEIKVSDSWRRLIWYVRNNVPHGSIKIEIVDGEPVNLLGEEKRVRFDKKSYFSDLDSA